MKQFIYDSVQYLLVCLVIGIFSLMFNSWNNDQDKKLKDLESRVESLEFENKALLHYKTVCEGKTSKQHDINTDHGAVIQFVIENNPGSAPAMEKKEKP